METIKHVLNKVLTFITSRRIWALAFVFYPFMDKILPVFEGYLGDSFEVISAMPVDQQTNALMAYVLSVGFVAIMAIFAGLRIVEIVLAAMTERPSTLRDYLEAVEDVVVQVGAEIEAVVEDIEELSEGDLPIEAGG